jgi:pimeloyl-ACP methyl ester carboxylesterase
MNDVAARARPGSVPSPTTADLSGAVRLLGDAVLGVTGIVEEMHRNIAGLSPLIGESRPGRTRGVAGLVYRGVRGVTHAVRPPAEAAVISLAPLLDRGSEPSPRREAMRAALNGVYGDHLADSGNPLAIPMSLRRAGREVRLERADLALSGAEEGDRLLVLAHGLCMNDLQWNRGGRDHGADLARELGYIPLYLHYNSGRRVSANGRQFADVLERLVREWPVPVRDLTLVGHSMGGLVSRSACHHAVEAGQVWPAVLKRIVFLGSPHHGAALERAGNLVDRFCGFSPYTAPVGRVGTMRSAGVKDLRHGNLVDEDWQGWSGAEVEDTRRPVPLPRGVECFAVAADRRRGPGERKWREPGDGLVSVTSALGQHAESQRALPIPDANRHVGYGMNHFDLLGSPEIFERVRSWLSAPCATAENP